MKSPLPPSPATQSIERFQWRRLWRWIPAVWWMSGIFIASGEAMSHGQTSQRFYPFFRWLIPGISEGTIDVLHFSFRKGGHLVAYAFLASLIWFAVGNTQRNGRKVALVWGLTVLYAALDEYRQSFTPSRGASVGDVAIDAAGAVLGIALICIIGRFRTVFQKQA